MYYNNDTTRMDELTKSIIFHIDRSFALLAKSIYNFKQCLEQNERIEAERFYFSGLYAHRRVQEYYKRALAIARGTSGIFKEFLIPREKIEEWKKKLATERNPIVAKNKLCDYVEAELKKDKILRTWLGKEEIERFMDQYFEEQLRGARKLSNIKLRIVLADVERIISYTDKLKKKAQNKLESFS